MKRTKTESGGANGAARNRTSVHQQGAPSPKTDRGASFLTGKRLLRYLGSYGWLIACSILFAAVSVVLSLYIPILVGRAIDCMVSAGNVDFDAMARILVVIAVCTGLTALVQWLMNGINNKITYQVIRDVRRDAFRKLTVLPLSYLDVHPHGETVSRVIADVDQFADGLLMGFSQLFTGVVTIVCTLVFMLTIHPLITLAVVLLTPLSFFVSGFIARRTYAMFRLQSETRGEQTAFLNEMVENQAVVRAFSYETEAMARFDEINGRLERCSLQAIFFSSITNPATRFINNVVYAAVGVTGALAALNGSISVGGLSSFLSYANQYTKPFNEISGVITELQNALACAARIFALIDQPAESPDAPDAFVLDGALGNVTLQNVAFSYQKDQPLIQNLSLNAVRGQRIAIVGPTGCGKTTLINLLMRFYDVDGGAVLVDGHDVRSVTRSSLHASYGMVLQDTWLKHGTVRENIAMGRAATEEEIVAAAKAAHAHSFIKRLPEGYHTVVSDESGGLSQGQRQLLCIARVMLRIPPMLILDEATSSIDTRTEWKIQEGFGRLMAGRTSFLVAHRLSTVREADLILVMKDGKIMEQGTHETLLARGGLYATLYNSQFDG